MSAEVETMFFTAGRETPWHGLGTQVDEAPDSERALQLAGLDWNVIQKDLYTNDAKRIPGFKANIRDKDGLPLGIVSDRYQVIQNREAFAFTDALLEEGVTYETAGSLFNGKQCWILARMPERYFEGDEIIPYLVFFNSHDGSSAVRVALTPVRVVCKNTLNLALRTAPRSWSAKHTGSIQNRLEDARDTLMLATRYMKELDNSLTELSQIKLSDRKVIQMVQSFYPISAEMNDLKLRRQRKLQEELKQRYFDAPDLMDVGKNGYRFINAVSDMATHSRPVRMTKNFKENNFKKITDGHAMIDRAYEMLRAA